MARPRRSSPQSPRPRRRLSSRASRSLLAAARLPINGRSTPSGSSTGAASSPPAKQADARLTRDAVTTWLRGLGIMGKVSKLADPPGGAGSLAAESAAAASALAGLEQENGNIFGSRRVIVLYCDDLSGPLPAGELAGDKVVVITSFLPTAAAASAAQAQLLGAGAAQAAVLGPEVTAAQVAALVSAGLSQNVMPELVSPPVLFANDSATLSPE